MDGESIRTLYNIFILKHETSIFTVLSLFFPKMVLYGFEACNDTSPLENFAHWKICVTIKSIMILKIRVCLLQKSLEIYCFLSRSFPRVNLENWSLVNFLKLHDFCSSFYWILNEVKRQKFKKSKHFATELPLTFEVQ